MDQSGALESHACKSLALLPGCANHYAYEPEYQDPASEPGRFFETATRALHAEDRRYLQEKELGADWYSSDGYASRLISHLQGRSADEKADPFFAYLPFSAPHWPLQAPKEVCDKYKGFYDDGPEALRQRRLARLKALEIVDAQAVAHPVVTTESEPAKWEHLSPNTKAASARAMEVYAAMVDRMDWNIGRVLDYLRESGEYDNTLVMFMSDNGAEGASYEAMPLVGKSIMAHVEKYYDNSLDNIGRGNSFVWYGPYWAQASTAPSRLYKMFSTEGGCRVPLVVKPVGNGRTSSCIITDAFCTVMDIVPTVLDLAGTSHPTQYDGRKIAPLRGRSWKPFLDGLANSTRKTPIHEADYVAGFEIAGSGALRQGDWKVTFVPAPRGPQRWELFNIANDPGETRDLSEAEPEKLAHMLALWNEYAKEVGVIGLAGEFPTAPQGAREATLRDEMEDPYAWIKYIGRPKITPGAMAKVVPS